METLIINKRHELPKTKRLIWDGVTVLLWLSFIYMWKPLLIIFYEIITLKEEPEQISYWIFENISSVTFEHAIFVLIATPVILFILSRLHRHKMPTEHLVYDSTDYSTYFDIDNNTLEECVKSQLITVYHNAEGQIINVENAIDTKSK